MPVADRFFSRRNLDFMLFDVFDVEALTQWGRYADHTRQGIAMVLDAAAKMAATLLYPHLEEMDRQPPVLENGRVTVHPAVRRYLRECGDGGWIAADFPYELDGEQLPGMVTSACRFMFAAANYSASVFPELTAGAAHLIAAFASPSLVAAYVPPMLDGRWQGTMALTEPDAGSALSDVVTTATPDGDGRYRIQGRKVFISAGDHDAVANVVHLLLARIDGAPPGTRGISLFVVPKRRVENGALVPNDVTVSQVFHKLGYRGAPITELCLGDQGRCLGHLVGEPHRGLSYMFQMMNEARIGVGIGAAGIASAAYYAALAYTRGRRQGRKPAEKDPTRPPIPLIEHADVKRMLLFQRSVVEGSLGLLLQCARYADQAHAGPAADREAAGLLLDLLTPVAKSYPAEMGIWAVSAGLQCLGGYGYCRDFPLEQYYRDARIHPIHEGTTGIQGMDLLGRKVVMHDGKGMGLLSAAVAETLSAAGDHPALAAQAAAMGAALERLATVTRHLVGVAATHGPEAYLADATLYLEMFGITVVAWQWLKQAAAAERALCGGASGGAHRFYLGKRAAADYFFAYELPKTLGLAACLTDDRRLTTEMAPELFDD
jgi:alkylation response protein AidB-like acyl-CoA dehydrogenase